MISPSSFLRFPCCPGHVPSIPFTSPFTPPVIFSVCPLHFPCPVLSLRGISLHLPSCRLVSLSFVSLSFPLRSPCFHFCPFHVLFMSLSCPFHVPFSSPLFPFHFPLLSCHVDFLFSPLISLHVLAFPFAPQYFPPKKTRFFQRFRKEDVPAKSRQGDSSLRPLFCDASSPKTTFSGTSSNYRAVRGGPPQTRKGWGYPLSSLRYPTRLRRFQVIGVWLLLVEKWMAIPGKLWWFNHLPGKPIDLPQKDTYDGNDNGS